MRFFNAGREMHAAPGPKRDFNLTLMVGVQFTLVFSYSRRWIPALLTQVCPTCRLLPCYFALINGKR